MKRMQWICASSILLVCAGILPAETEKPSRTAFLAQTSMAPTDPTGQQQAPATLDAQRERRALAILLRSMAKEIVSVAEAMPADKYGFAPTDGEFKGVRTFGKQVKHLAATNHILAAAALGEEPPAAAGDELGPEAIRTKVEIIDYLNSSFTHLQMAVDAIGDEKLAVKSSPISPLSAITVTRLALVVEACVHAFNHYGQMVEYLRMNGVLPPASRP
jgi:uncharacterized damage-inducible protein DinB